MQQKIIIKNQIKTKIMKTKEELQEVIDRKIAKLKEGKINRRIEMSFQNKSTFRGCYYPEDDYEYNMTLDLDDPNFDSKIMYFMYNYNLYASYFTSYRLSYRIDNVVLDSESGDRIEDLEKLVNYKDSKYDKFSKEMQSIYKVNKDIEKTKSSIDFNKSKLGKINKLKESYQPLKKKESYKETLKELKVKLKELEEEKVKLDTQFIKNWGLSTKELNSSLTTYND